MPPTSGDAFLDSLGPEQIPALAALYDRFAHAIDPFDPACDTAERAFNNAVAEWYDCLHTPSRRSENSAGESLLGVNAIS